ncbi:MAG: phosphohistidine phosphatase [Mariniblastus sp.]|jgi:phosphohistidine phosphatase
MSKQLLIMRHAKSSWAEGGLTDFQRPLNKRGLRDAPRVAEFIHSQGLTPDLVVSSSAERAKTTAETFVEHCPGVEQSQIQLLESFYHAPARTHLDFLASFSLPHVETLLLVGHNPGLEDLVEALSGAWEVMPTSAVAHFDLGIESWSDLKQPIRADLKNIWRPKEIELQ